MPGTYKTELEYWETKATEIRRGQTEAFRRSATKWAAVLTALLGAFGAVAFAGGLTTIEDLPDGWVLVVRILTSLAAALSVVSIVALSIVSGGLRMRLQQSAVTALQLADEETEPSKELRTLFRWGRVAAIAAAACVLIGSGAVLWVSPAAPAASPVQSIVVKFDDGSACGEPKRSGEELTLDGRNLSEAVEITPVSKCP